MKSILFQTDWRLKDRPVDYLFNAKLSYVQIYRPYRKLWDHEHCTFCFAGIGSGSDELHSGYCTTDVDVSREDWICENCYQDFEQLFEWTVKTYPELYGCTLYHEIFYQTEAGKKFTRCVLCLTRISQDEDSLKYGYHLRESDIWICPFCSNAHKEKYQWSLH